MKLRVAIVTLVTTMASFAAGMAWPPAPEMQALMAQVQATATAPQVALFLLLALVRSLVFGLGVSFLLFGYPMVRSVGSVSSGLSRAAHLSIAWFLVNWFPHDNLHLKVYPAVEVLLAIEYGFHMTLMAAGAVLAYFYIKVVRERRTVPL